MKRFFTVISSAAIFLISFTSVAHAATTDINSVPVASARIPGSLVPMSPLQEEYSWLFWPGLIAAGVVVVLVINIIYIKKRKND